MIVTAFPLTASKSRKMSQTVNTFGPFAGSIGRDDCACSASQNKGQADQGLHNRSLSLMPGASRRNPPAGIR
ncbi:MAG: hypothetical protein K0Q71_6029 [Thermomicrobiales bacterium]|nr:hypothetical protein [Thermomicrobiales bacterium]